MERTPLALGLEFGGGNFSRARQFKEGAQCGKNRFPKGGIKLHPRAEPGLRVENHALGYREPQHFLQTQGLGTKLGPVVDPLRFPARLVFHRTRLRNASAGFPDLDDIRLPAEPERI